MPEDNKIVAASASAAAFFIREAVKEERNEEDTNFLEILDSVKAQFSDGLKIADPVFYDGDVAWSRTDKVALDIAASHSMYAKGGYAGGERNWCHSFVATFRLNDAPGRTNEQKEPNYSKIGERLTWAFAIWIQRNQGFPDSSGINRFTESKVEGLTYPPVFSNKDFSDISGADESINQSKKRTSGRTAAVRFKVFVNDGNIKL